MGTRILTFFLRMYEYQLVDGKHHLLSSKQKVSAVNGPVAIGFVVVEGQVASFRHGSIQEIEKWARQQRTTAARAEEPEWGTVVMATTNDYPLETINKCVQNQRSCAKILTPETAACS